MAAIATKATGVVVIVGTAAPQWRQGYPYSLLPQVAPHERVVESLCIRKQCVSGSWCRGSSDAQCHWRFSVLPHYVLYHNDFYNDREAARVNGATKKKWRIDGSALFSCINM